MDNHQIELAEVVGGMGMGVWRGGGEEEFGKFVREFKGMGGDVNDGGREEKNGEGCSERSESQGRFVM